MHPVSRRELIKRLRKLGFEGPFSGGKHAFMRRDKLKLRIPNPHSNEDIGVPLLLMILEQGGITQEEWESVK